MSAQLLCNRISRNFLVDKDILCTCAYSQEILIWFFLREEFELWPKYTISCNSCDTGLAWMRCNSIRYFFDSERSNVTQMCQLLINHVYPIITATWLWFSAISLLHCIAIRLKYAAMLERGVCELAHSFIHIFIYNIIEKKRRCSIFSSPDYLFKLSLLLMNFWIDFRQTK